MRRRQILVLVLLLLTGAGLYFNRLGLRSVALSQEELVSVYKIPVKEQPTEKFEWTVVGKKYFRAVVEESPADRTEWKTRESFPYNFPAHTGTLIYTIASRGEPAAGRNAWLILLRIGGSGGSISGWSGNSFLLPVPAGNYSTESIFNDPDRILVIRAAGRQFRLRMESSDTPYTKLTAAR